MELTETQRKALSELVSEHGITNAQALCADFFSALQVHRELPADMGAFLQALLDGAYTDESEINRIFRHFTGSLFRKYTVLVLSFEGMEVSVPAVMQELSQLGDYWSFRVQDFIVCLNAHNTDIRNSSGILEILHRYRLTAGSSRPFEQLADFRESFLQALDTVKTALALQHYGSFAQYDDFLMIRLFDQMPEDVNLDFFALPDIVILQKYDKTHHTELCRTMLCYLQHSKNVAGTAAELCVHRNTVHYRISKCSELLSSLDLENDYITFLLMLSLHIAEYNFYRERKNAEAALAPG